MLKETLKKIGLTSNEAKIYLSLLELGPSLVKSIVDKTQINRTHIYDCLKKLIDKGIVAYVIKNNRKQFYAAQPKRILRYLDEKEEKIEKERTQVKKILPILEKIIPIPKKENVEVYEGKEGLKTILEDILRTKKEILTYGSKGNFTRILKYYFEHYLKKLQRSRIKMKVIFSETQRKPLDWKHTQVKYVPKEYETPTETTIYGDKVAIFLLIKEPKAILITSKTMADSYKKHFELLWKIGN